MKAVRISPWLLVSGSMCLEYTLLKGGYALGDHSENKWLNFWFEAHSTFDIMKYLEKQFTSKYCDYVER